MPMKNQYTDRMLLDRLRSGDTRAFDALFRRYYPLLCAYGNRFVSLESAEEIAQDVMLWLWEHHEDEVVRFSLVKYMLKAVYQRALNRIEQEQVKLHADTRFYQDLVEDTLEEADLCAVNELSERLHEAIRQLPERQRLVFNLRYYDELDYADISEILETQVETLKTNFFYAKENIKKYIQKYYDERI